MATSRPRFSPASVTTEKFGERTSTHWGSPASSGLENKTAAKVMATQWKQRMELRIGKVPVCLWSATIARLRAAGKRELGCTRISCGNSLRADCQSPRPARLPQNPKIHVALQCAGGGCDLDRPGSRALRNNRGHVGVGVDGEAGGGNAVEGDAGCAGESLSQDLRGIARFA